jgi:hypothetical protein
MVWNNLVALYACINSIIASSIDFGVFIYAIGFLDPFANDPISYTNFLLSPNSNGCPFTNLGLVTSTCSFGGLNITKEGYVSILSICSLVACKSSCVCCCWCCKCCKCWKCCGLLVVSIQSSYTSPSKCKCSSPFGDLVSCSLLTFCLCYLSCLSCGHVICGAFAIYLAIYISLLALHMVPLYPSSIFVPLLLCFLVPF